MPISRGVLLTLSEILMLDRRWTEPSQTACVNEEGRPLTERILKQRRYRNVYTGREEEATIKHCASSHIAGRVWGLWHLGKVSKYFFLVNTHTHTHTHVYAHTHTKKPRKVLSQFPVQVTVNLLLCNKVIWARWLCALCREGWG